MKHFFKPIFLFAILFVTLGESAYAQDARFSQYYNSPWNLNPAMTGVFDGRYRVALNYRDQWNSFLSPVPFRTTSGAFDMRYNVNNDDYIAFGLGVMHDEAGTSSFNQNKANLGVAFQKQLSGGRYKADHYISAGAQFGGGQNSIDAGKLWFSKQFDTTTETPNTTASNGENNINNSSGFYSDLNAGLLWYVVYDNEGFIYAGAAMNHLNKPNISFTGDKKERLYSRWVAHAGGQVPLTENFFMMPAVQVMKQGPAFETDLSANVRYTNHDRNELGLRTGLSGRFTNRLDKGLQFEALTFLAMIEYQRWTLGLSYDVTTSTLTRANNSRGAFEISLIYYHPEHRRSKVKCPKF